MNLPEEYVSSKFYQFVGAPKYNKIGKTYQGSCPICKEGSSWLKKRRFFFIPAKNLMCCHNCGYKQNPIRWLWDVQGLSFYEIRQELEKADFEYGSHTIQIEPMQKTPVASLPKNCINLTDSTQVEFYKNNRIVKSALEFLLNRRLLECINPPNSFFISLEDFVHKNRLVIPFYDNNNKIVHYQTRALDTDNKVRYISKVGSEKTLFNINNIKSDSDSIFIFEGPLNSCFVKNGIAVAGIQEGSYQLFTKKQEEQIADFPVHSRIWIMDSQWLDSAGLNKSKKLLELGESVFIWPKQLGQKYKDFNDICVDLKINKIATEYIKKHTYSGNKGLDKLSKIN